MPAAVSRKRNMNIVLVNRFFHPDESATSLLLTDLAEDLALLGHKVTVLSSRMLYENNGVALPIREKMPNGVEVNRVPSTRLGRKRFVTRLLDIGSFHWNVRRLGSSLPHPDAWFVMTDPPYILDRVLALREKLGGKIVHHVDDLYPDVAIALGTLPQRNFLARLLEKWSRQSLNSADILIALGECMADRLHEKGIGEEKIRVAPPWADGRSLRPFPHRDNPFRTTLGCTNGDFSVMYSGNMGQGHCFDTILKAIGGLRNEKGIHFVFIGGGARKSDIVSYQKHHALNNLQVLGYQPRDYLRESLSAGDVHLISLDRRVQGMIVPSKLAGILAVGRPVIFVGDNQNSVAQAIIRGNCGFVVPEGNVGMLQQSILKLRDDPATCNRLGLNARSIFELEFDRSVIVPRIIDWLCK